MSSTPRAPGSRAATVGHSPAPTTAAMRRAKTERSYGYQEGIFHDPPTWPVTRKAVVVHLEELTRRLIEAFHDDLDPMQEMARRLALTNISAARETLCIAADAS